MYKSLILLSCLFTSPITLLNTNDNATFSRTDIKRLNDYDATTKIYLIDLCGEGTQSNNYYLYRFYAQALNYGYIYDSEILYINYTFGYDAINLTTRTTTSYNLMVVDTWDYFVADNKDYILQNIERLEISVSLTNIVLGPSNSDMNISPTSHISIIANSDNWFRVDNSQFTKKNITFIEQLTNVSINGSSAFSNRYSYERSLYPHDAYLYGTEKGYQDGFIDGKDEGYKEGYAKGLENPKDLFSLLSNAFNGLSSIFNIELLPGLSIGLLVFAPLFIGVILVILKLVVK